MIVWALVKREYLLQAEVGVSYCEDRLCRAAICRQFVKDKLDDAIDGYKVGRKGLGNNGDR